MYGPAAYKGPWAAFREKTPEVDDEDESGEEVEVEVEVEIDSDGNEREITSRGDDDGDTEDQGAVVTKPTTDYAPENKPETSTFLGSHMHDYQGRTYMHVPRDLGIDLVGERADDARNFVPKNTLHVWREGAGAAVTQMRFFPSSGHLLLGASASGTVRLWDVYHERELLREYRGHSRSCNDVVFSDDGTEFLTASYDRKMKLWDTETGQCKGRYGTGKTPHVVRFQPGGNNEFLAGMGDKKIVQFDVRSGEMVQEYDHHLGPVNTITFCDEGKRFVTTSDDKSLRAWEYGIPVPIKVGRVDTTPSILHRRIT